MSSESEILPHDSETLPPEISAMNDILSKMISGENVGEAFNECCLKIQDKSHSMLVEHSRRERQKIIEMEYQLNLQKQTYDKRINFVLDSCQAVAESSLSSSFSRSMNKPQDPHLLSFGRPVSDQEQPIFHTEQDATPTSLVAEDVQFMEEIPSAPTGSNLSKKRTSIKIITRLPKEKHGFNNMKFHQGFFCLCGQELSSKCNLRRHIKLHTQKKKLFSCTNSDCTKSFVSLNLLKKHQKDIHKMQDNIGEGTIGCSDCGKIFASQLLHRRHKRKCNC